MLAVPTSACLIIILSFHTFISTIVYSFSTRTDIYTIQHPCPLVKYIYSAIWQTKAMVVGFKKKIKEGKSNVVDVKV